MDDTAQSSVGRRASPVSRDKDTPDPDPDLENEISGIARNVNPHSGADKSPEIPDAAFGGDSVDSDEKDTDESSSDDGGTAWDTDHEEEDEPTTSAAAAAAGPASSSKGIMDLDFSFADEPKNRSIKQYYSKQEYRDLGKLQRKRNRNLKLNYVMLRTFGFNPPVPLFMKKKFRRPREVKPPSDSDSDYDPKKRKPKKGAEFRKEPSKAQMDKTFALMMGLPIPPSPLKPKRKKVRMPKKKKPSLNWCDRDVEWETISDSEEPLPTSPKDPPEPPTWQFGQLGMSTPEEGAGIFQFIGFTPQDVQEIQRLADARITLNEQCLEIMETNRPTPELLRQVQLTSPTNRDWISAMAGQGRPGMRRKERVFDLPEPRYPKRNIPRVNYAEVEMPDEDRWVYCEFCDEEFLDGCVDHPMTIFEDIPLPPGYNPAERALATMPPYLKLGRSRIPGAGGGMFTRMALPLNSRFGPYEGEVVYNHFRAEKSGYSWEVYRNEKHSHYIDGEDKRLANWMRYVNCARTEVEQNLIAYPYDQQVYYKTIRAVAVGEELLVWYGDLYGSELTGPGTPQPSPRRGARCKLPGHPEQPGEQPGAQAKSHGAEDSKPPVCGKVSSQPDQPGRTLQSLPASASATPQDPAPVGDRESEDCVKEVGGNLIYCCGKCTSAFTTELYLLKHRKNKHGEFIDLTVRIPPLKSSEQSSNKDGVNVSETCGEEHKENTAAPSYHGQRQEPMRIRSDTSGKLMHRCPVCGKQFGKNKDCVKHIRVHTGEKPYSCEVCGRRFNQGSHYHRHMMTHTGEKPYSCEVCGRGFSQGSSYHTHMKTHTGDKPYSCEVCGYKSSLKQNHDSHMRTHTGEKPYSCEVCGRGFSQGSSYHRHMRSHTGERPHSCEVCGRGFSDGGNYHTHMRTHTGEKPYSCEVCGHKSSRKQQHDDHMSVHTGVYKMSCPDCGKGYNKTWKYKKHLNTHSSNSP